MHKVGPAIEERDKAGEDERAHGARDAKGRDVGEGRVGDVLGVARAHKVDVGGEDGNPG